MTKKIDLPVFDPWFGTEPSFTHTPDPEAPPVSWHRLNLGTRDRVGGLLVHICAVTPHAGVRDVSRLLPIAQRALRACWQPVEEMAENATMKEALAGYYVTDPVERQKYRVAEDEIHAPSVDPSFLLESAIVKLIKGGDLVATLDARIAALTAQRERIVKLSAGARR